MARPRNPKTAAAPAHRTSVSELAKLLAERKSGGTSSVTIKISAQGQFMPEITVVAGEDKAVIDTMVKQAKDAYTDLLKAVS